MSRILFTGGEYLGRYPPDQVPPWSRHPLPRPGTPPTRIMYTPEQTLPEQISPRDQVHPPGSDTPQEQTLPPPHPHPWEQVPPQPPPPPAQSMLRDTVNARAVRILLECNLVLEIKTFVWKSKILSAKQKYPHLFTNNDRSFGCPIINMDMLFVVH